MRKWKVRDWVSQVPCRLLRVRNFKRDSLHLIAIEQSANRERKKEREKTVWWFFSKYSDNITPTAQKREEKKRNKTPQLMGMQTLSQTGFLAAKIRIEKSANSIDWIFVTTASAPYHKTFESRIHLVGVT